MIQESDVDLVWQQHVDFVSPFVGMRHQTVNDLWTSTVSSIRDVQITIWPHTAAALCSTAHAASEDVGTLDERLCGCPSS
jgi:hypothetical protein